MPVKVSVNVAPRTPSTPPQEWQPHSPQRPSTTRSRSGLKRRITGIFRERHEDTNTSSNVIIPNSSPNCTTFRRPTPVSALRHTSPPEQHFGANSARSAPQASSPRDLPPSYTILASPTPDHLTVAHPPPPSLSASHQLQVPPRSSSIVCRQLRTSPSVTDLDESSHTLIQSLYNEQARRLERERIAQYRADADLAFALALQQQWEEELRGERPLPHSQSPGATETQPSRNHYSQSPATTRSPETTESPSDRHPVPSFMRRSRSTSTSQTRSSSPLMSSNPRYARECFICKRWKHLKAFPDFTPTELCQHESSTCSHCLKQWVNSKLKIRGTRNVNCSQCRIILSPDEIHRARVLHSKG